MSKQIDTILGEWLKKAYCAIFGHAWLTPLYGRHVCNRCGVKEIRSPKTDWKWVPDVDKEKSNDGTVQMAKPFNPID